MITEEMLKRAAQVFRDGGFEISLPSEGDLDDVERERYETLKAALTAALSDQVVVPKEQFDRAIKLLKQNTGLLCESGNLNNYRNLSDAELGKAWVETATRTAEFLNEIEGVTAPPPVSPAEE